MSAAASVDSETGDEHMKHSIAINAPARTVQTIISEALNWPIFFAPTIACEQTALDADQEELNLWARKGELDTVVSWRSIRRLDSDKRRISFRQQEPKPPLTELSGGWIIHEVDESTTELSLTHRIEATDDEVLRVSEAATDYNSVAELEAVKTLAETYGSALGDHIVRTHDEVWISASADRVFSALWDVAEWPRMLDHVDKVTVHSASENQHRFSMELGGNAAQEHTVESVRVARPGQWLAFKQIQTPKGVFGHAGTWTIDERDGKSRVVVEHQALLEPNNDVPLSELSARLSANLSRSSLSTLNAIERLTAPEAAT